MLHVFPIAHSPSAAMSIGSYGNEQEDSQEYESEVEMQCDSHGMVVLGMGFDIYAHLSSSSTLDNKVCVFPIAHSQSTVMSTGSSGKEQEESQECESWLYFAPHSNEKFHT